jgi:hypothetical protein
MISKMPPVIAGMLFLTGATVVTGGVMTYQAGSIRVSVDEKKPGGDHVHIIVPAILVSPAMGMIPEKELRKHAKEIRPWLPAIRAACKELDRIPDAVLVEVINRTEHVTITKHGGAINIDVVDENENVHVAVPLRTVQSVAEKLASGEPLDGPPDGPPV